MSNYANGNATAFEDLYRRHKGPLYRYFLRQCGSAAESEELFQDVWLRFDPGTDQIPTDRQIHDLFVYPGLTIE